MKFEIETTFIKLGRYTVEAKDKEEAEDKFAEGDWDTFEEDDVDNPAEEVISIQPL